MISHVDYEFQIINNDNKSCYLINHTNNECEINVVSGIFEFNNEINMKKYELPNYR